MLVGQSTEVQGQRWQSENRLRIGRFSNDIDVVMNDSSVSPHHAEVVATRQGWVVRDLGSMYGTYLNGSAVTGRQQFLNENDELRFGRLVLEVKFVPPATSPPDQGAGAQ